MPPFSPDAPAGFPDALAFPEPLGLHFEGFSSHAFTTLAALRDQPHVEQYRRLKPALDQHVVAPFKRYRDDLALNWVIANGLPFETEKNVFSRILKNDWGAGGSHSHLWMAFYRQGSKRLHDAQLSHSLDPDGFTVGLYVGDYAQAWTVNLRERIGEAPGAFFDLLAALPEKEGWRAFVYAGAGQTRREVGRGAAAAAALPAIRRAKGFWVRRTFEKADVLAWGPALVAHSLAALAALWPLYLYFLAAAPHPDA